MELTLNLVWVGVAIAAVLSLLTTLLRSGAQLRSPASYSRKVIAMGCALVILFFVISMTDDLHNQALLLEESKFSRINSGTRTSAHSGSYRSADLHVLQFFPVVPFSLPGLPVWNRLIQPLKLRFAATIQLDEIRGRAPPAVHA